MPAIYFFFVFQDESRNGTFVNGKLLGTGKKRIICNDDVISLAHEKYKFYKFVDIERQNTNGIPKDILKKAIRLSYAVAANLFCWRQPENYRQ